MFGPVVYHLSYSTGLAVNGLKNGQLKEVDIYRFTGSF